MNQSKHQIWRRSQSSIETPLTVLERESALWGQSRSRSQFSDFDFEIKTTGNQSSFEIEILYFLGFLSVIHPDLRLDQGCNF